MTLNLRDPDLSDVVCKGVHTVLRAAIEPFMMRVDRRLHIECDRCASPGEILPPRPITRKHITFIDHAVAWPRPAFARMAAHIVR